METQSANGKDQRTFIDCLGACRYDQGRPAASSHPAGRLMRTVVLALPLSAVLLLGGAGWNRMLAAAPVDYLRQVKPILAARCYACHGNLKRESGLRLDTAALIRRGGEGGA